MVEDEPAVFERNSLTGRAVLTVRGETAVLQSPWNALTHVSLSTTKQWTTRSAGHEITVVKERALMFGGLRPAQFKVEVDGAEVASAVGY